MINENATSGNVGAPLTATDADGDTLAYSVAATSNLGGAAHLASFNADFSLDSATGQITVKPDAVISYESRLNYRVAIQVTDNENAAGETDSAIDDTLDLTVNVINLDEAGTVTIAGTPQAGVELAASVSDPDGSSDGRRRRVWVWSRSDNAAGTTNTEVISGASHRDLHTGRG